MVCSKLSSQLFDICHYFAGIADTNVKFCSGYDNRWRWPSLR